jgi:hypothetical protein
MAHHNHIRWHNPEQGLYEWREAPRTDEEALRLLADSSYSPTCTQTYHEWRGLGATITAALIRQARRQTTNARVARMRGHTKLPRYPAAGQLLGLLLTVVFPGGLLYRLSHEPLRLKRATLEPSARLKTRKSGFRSP